MDKCSKGQVGDYFVDDFIACYDSLVGCLNPELGLKFWTEVQDCPVTVWGWMCGLGMACFGLDLDSLGLDLRLFYARIMACLCGL